MFVVEDAEVGALGAPLSVENWIFTLVYHSNLLAQGPPATRTAV